MGDRFFLSFLSKNTIEELRSLFSDEKPTPRKISALIDQLAANQAIDSLQLLLVMLQEPSQQSPETTSLITDIHRVLLKCALNSANQEEIIFQLTLLKKLIGNEEVHIWQDLLPDLIKWLEHPQQAQDIKQVLTHLPYLARERLFQSLFEILEDKPIWLDPLVDFVLAQIDATPGDSSQTLHFCNLAHILLLSPLNCNDSKIRELSLLLTTQQLVKITFQTRAIASTYLDNNKNLKQIYLKNYENLLTALAVRATTSQKAYHELTRDNAELANLLMSKRLKTLVSVEEQQSLVVELLENLPRFDWQDAQFNTQATEQIISVFCQLSSEELKKYFQIYYEYFSKHNQNDVSHFLDSLFFKTYDASILLSCLEQCDDEDKTLTINYLTSSQSQDNYLIRLCLTRLDEKRLINICGHIVALKQAMQQQEQAPIIDVYAEVLADKIRSSKTVDQTLEHYAKIISLLPETAQDDPINALFTQFINDTSLQYRWLNALLANHDNKSTLLGFCQTVLKKTLVHEQVKLLNYFSCEDLFALYLHLIRHQASDEDLNGFVELFKDVSREPLLLYILCNTPLIGQTFLDKLMPTIDSRNLITLIEELILLVQNNKDYRATLEQLLIYFCSRLQSTTNGHDPIHQWTMCEYSHLFAQHLLVSPACFISMASRSSVLQDYMPNPLQGLLVTSAANDLKLRVIRLFDKLQLDETSAMDVALTLLSHFCHQPHQLETLFVNIESVQSNMSGRGNLQYQCFKKACWQLLKSREQDHYDPKSASLLLTSQLATPHRFDTILARLAVNLSNIDNAQLSAQYLTQINSPNLANIDQLTLVTILLKSMEENTQGNWMKAAVFLQSSTIETSLVFIKLLIKQISACQNNPLLVEQVLQFITHLQHFDDLLPRLDDAELQWIMKQSKDDFLYNQFPQWLDILLNQDCFQRINGGAVLALLPKNQAFLDSVLQHRSLLPHLHHIFIEFSRQPQATLHFIALFQQINKQNHEEKRKLIEFAHQNLNPQQMLSVTAPVLNMLLLSLPNLQISSPSDREVVTNQLQLFSEWAANPPSDLLSRPGFMRELQQLVFNTLTSLNAQDRRWAGHILSSEFFAALALTWLPDLDSKTLNHHPFTLALLENITIRLHPDLLNNGAFQDYLMQLLTNPPAKLNDDQFAMLFDLLPEEAQQALALKLLSRSTLDDVQWFSLHTLSQALSPEILFTIFEKSATRFVFVDLLARHHMGIASLTGEQRNTLISSLDSGKQLLRILDSQTPKAQKFNFVAAIFDYLGQSEISLPLWLDNLHIDGQTLAAFANYTEGQKNQQQLQELIHSSNNQEKEIQLYLRNPCLDLAIEPSGLLYRFMRNAWLNPGQGWHCHADLLAIMDKKSILISLKKQSAFLTQTHQLADFYEPFLACGEIGEKMLVASRWLQRLPLLSNGLLEIINEYRTTDNMTLRNGIKKTALYNKLIAPLLSGANEPDLLAIQLNELYSLLHHYLDDIKTLCSKHHQALYAILQQFQNQLATIEHRSSLRLINLFNPLSYFAKIKKGQIMPLKSIETSILAAAADQHQQFLADHHYCPQTRMQELLQVIIDNRYLLETEEIQNWLLQDCLFSPLAAKLNLSLLNRLLCGFQPAKFAQQMRQIEQQLQIHGRSYKTLQQLTALSTIPELIDTLQTQESQDLILQLEACEFAQLPHLTNIILLALHAKRLELPTTSLNALTPGSLTDNLEMDWLSQDLKKLESIQTTLLQKHHQIELEGLRYHPDQHNSIRLAELPKSAMKKTDSDSLAQCLSSYLPVFDKHGDKEIIFDFMRAFNLLLTQSDHPGKFLIKLQDELLNQIILFALQTPEIYENLLEQLMQNGFSDKCSQFIKMHLADLLKTFIKPEPSTIAPQTLAEISIQQLAQIPSVAFKHTLFLQRFLFFLEPLPGLKNWQNAPVDEQLSARRYFCADAGIHFLLTQFSQKMPTEEAWPLDIKDNLDIGYTFLSKQAKALSYYSLMETFGKTNAYQQPVVFFHYLSLFYFLNNDAHSLLENFANWLEQCEYPDKHNELEQLLQFILHHHLLTELCLILRMQPTLEKTRADWLYAKIRQTKPVDAALIENLVTAFSWEWLQEQIQNTDNPGLALLQAALQKDWHINEIIDSESHQCAFLDLLDHNQLPFHELLDLQKNTHSSAICSLLALHLLSRADYIQQAGGQALISKLGAMPGKRIKRPLQPLVQMINEQYLPTAALKKLEPEAAASLLCSPRHFHILDEKIIPLLLNKIGMQPDTLISYWLIYYANMPQGEKPLIALINQFTKQTLAALNQMSIMDRRPLLMSLIEAHASQNLPSTLALKGFYPIFEEPHLAQAIQLYLHRNEQRQPLIQLIKNLLESMLTSSNLTSKTIQLLIRITEDENFIEYRDKLSLIVGDYLHSSALFSDCSVFYDEGRLAIKRLQKPVALAEEHSKNESRQGVLAYLLKPLYKAMPENQSETINPNQLPENPFLDKMAQHFGRIQSIDYFLIHYRGEAEALQDLVDDYLDYYDLEQHSRENWAKLHATSWLISCSELSNSTRQVLFNSFCQHSQLLDGQITAHLFCFDARKVIAQLTSRKNYQALIKCCQDTLPYLEHAPETAKIVQQVIDEAQFELSLAGISPFLRNWRIYISRCFFYGWAGWFTPKQPQYVIPFENQTQKSSKKSPTIVKENINLAKLPQSFEDLLPIIEKDFSIQNIAILHDALIIYEWEDKRKDELSNRIQIDSLFTSLLEQAKSSRKLEQWLSKHYEPFLKNREKLIAFYCQLDDQPALAALLQIAREGPGYFREIADEFHVETAPSLIAICPQPTPPTSQQTSIFSGALNNVTSIFWPAAQITEDNAQVQTPQQGFFGGWFN